MVSGTREWSVKSVNCCFGCKHNCRYCYARWEAESRYKTLEPGSWPEMKVNEVAVNRKWAKYSGTVMFPTTHDITPEILEPCLTVLSNLIDKGNNVLIVSKPHEECIAAICRRYTHHQNQILFRFTIGSYRNTTLSYWEPNAPSFEERLFCLHLAYAMGYHTSVSIEPFLDDISEVAILVNKVLPYVSNTVWIGKMNNIRHRVKIENDIDRLAVELIELRQTDMQIKMLYDHFKDTPQIRWKESIKQVVGMPLAQEAGLDT